MAVRRLVGIFKWTAAVAVVIVAAIIAWGYAVLYYSQPILAGESPASGLQAPVDIERDKDGVVTIVAANRAGQSI